MVLRVYTFTRTFTFAFTRTLVYVTLQLITVTVAAYTFAVYVVCLFYVALRAHALRLLLYTHYGYLVPVWLPFTLRIVPAFWLRYRLLRSLITLPRCCFTRCLRLRYVWFCVALFVCCRRCVSTFGSGLHACRVDVPGYGCLRVAFARLHTPVWLVTGFTVADVYGYCPRTFGYAFYSLPRVRLIVAPHAVTFALVCVTLCHTFGWLLPAFTLPLPVGCYVGWLRLFARLHARYALLCCWLPFTLGLRLRYYYVVGYAGYGLRSLTVVRYAPFAFTVGLIYYTVAFPRCALFTLFVTFVARVVGFVDYIRYVTARLLRVPLLVAFTVLRFQCPFTFALLFALRLRYHIRCCG